MMRFQPAIFTLSLFYIAGAAHAQTALDAQLAKAMKPLESKGQQHLGKPGGNPAASVRPSWSVDNDGSKPDQPCGMTYAAPGKVMGYIGPYKEWKDSYFFVGGPEVPTTAKVKKVKVTLATGGDSPQTVKAVHFPVKDGAPVILFQLTNFAAALDGMDDVESVSVTMNGASVFDGNWTGGFAAREKVRACLLRVK